MSALLPKADMELPGVTFGADKLRQLGDVRRDPPGLVLVSSLAADRRPGAGCVRQQLSAAQENSSRQLRR
jgi:hypothetical protein